MDLWISMYNTQMANNLVKWWKTKFLNGYKQFSVVECGNAKVSDTEELLGRLGSEDDSNDRLRTSCTTPPLQSKEGNVPSTTTPTEDGSTPKKQTPQNQLNFEEFSCDVSVENNGGGGGGDNKSGGQERQEFSFTLYDFDGHGKITKDDIAGLVTTIYEALGSSVKVPHYGSKTIKVKLTVSPDQRKHMSATIINEKDNQNNDDNKQSIRYKRDLNVTIRQSNDNNNKQRLHNKRNINRERPTANIKKCCNKHDEEEDAFVSDDSSDVYSRLSGQLSSEEGEGECSDGNNERLANKPKKTRKKCNKLKNSPRYTIPNLFMREPSICNENTCSVKAKSIKKQRSGSLQRQELLDIIQANMDKNNLGFQTARKHSNRVGGETKHFSEQKYHNNKRPVTTTTSPLQYLANIVDPTHFYVDLASLQNTTKSPQNNYQYDKLIDAVMCVSSKKVKQPLKCRKHRTKSETVPLRYQFLQCAEEPRLKTNKRAHKKSANVEVKCFNKASHVVTGHTSSPHHLKHRNRQEDQARAMAQVVHWLEQEFSSNMNTTEEREQTKTTHKEKIHTNTTPPSGPGIERHEHHHVHEHIHHHYHHYQDAPLVV